jgi:hypothetical protein
VRDEVSEMLDYTPGTFTVERHVRPIFACPQRDQQGKKPRRAPEIAKLAKLADMAICNVRKAGEAFASIAEIAFASATTHSNEQIPPHRRLHENSISQTIFPWSGPRRGIAAAAPGKREETLTCSTG